MNSKQVEQKVWEAYWAQEISFIELLASLRNIQLWAAKVASEESEAA